MDTIALHNDTLSPHNESRQALFPYLVVEWKSRPSGGTIEQATDQAIRDGAAAVRSMYNLYRASQDHITSAQTAIFSAVITSREVDLRVHWRQEAKGKTYWNTKVFEAGGLGNEEEMIRICRDMKNMLDWAQGPQLLAIKKQLSRLPSLSARLDSGDPSVSQLPSPAASQLTGPATNKRQRLTEDDTIAS